MYFYGLGVFSVFDGHLDCKFSNAAARYAERHIRRIACNNKGSLRLDHAIQEVVIFQ